jgi:hypothetical protein
MQAVNVRKGYLFRGNNRSTANMLFAVVSWHVGSCFLVNATRAVMLIKLNRAIKKGGVALKLCAGCLVTFAAVSVLLL